MERLRLHDVVHANLKSDGSIAKATNWLAVLLSLLLLLMLQMLEASCSSHFPGHLVASHGAHSHYAPVCFGTSSTALSMIPSIGSIVDKERVRLPGLRAACQDSRVGDGLHVAKQCSACHT